MKRTNFFIAALLLIAMSSYANPSVARVEPLSWWTNMRTPLTLLIQGQDLADAQVSIAQVVNGKVMKGQCLGLQVKQAHNAESPNYLFMDMQVNDAGTYRITLTKGKKTATFDYVIAERRANPAANTSYGPEDVIYLLMPDRFANGNKDNDSFDPKKPVAAIQASIAEAAHPNEWFGRHGGDIEGIMAHLDDIKALGATAIWPTPLLLDNEPVQSYHGYACADYYHIDPRFGTNESYKTLVETAHNKGLKFIMDIVPNHCGAAHWWIKDLPFHDWIHQYPSFTRSNWQFTTAADIHSSKQDAMLMNSGWFDTAMPDMNLDNPYLLHYFQMWAVWWIEYANLDGLRVDTYPYNEKVPISQWTAAVRNEYPGINIVGECWTRPTSAIAYWQADAPNLDGYNSHLPCVMDFPLMEALCKALGDKNGNLDAVYNTVADDYLYAHPYNILIFDGNHDTPRILDVLADHSIERNKLVLALMVTMRGIPQIMYGEEVGLRTLEPKDIGNHGALRVDMYGDNAQKPNNDLKQYYTRLLNWRQSSRPIHKGRLMHFLSHDNTYAYMRYTDDEAVFVFLNAASEPRKIPAQQYEELLRLYNPSGEDVISGKTINIAECPEVAPLTAIIVPLNKK